MLLKVLIPKLQVLRSLAEELYAPTHVVSKGVWGEG